MSISSIVDETFQYMEEVVFAGLGEYDKREEKEKENIKDNTSKEETKKEEECLKKRLAQYRNRNVAQKAAFKMNVWAVEKFRDLAPALVIAILEGGKIMLEPGDVGPLSPRDPVAQELITCLNTNTLSLPLLYQLRLQSAPFYDGAVVFGIVDYRKSESFGTPSRTAANTNTANGTGTSASTSRSLAPEMHKILLRPDPTQLQYDIQDFASTTPSKGGPFKLENALLTRTSPPLCLDPSPMVSNILRFINWERKKFFLSTCDGPYGVGSLNDGCNGAFNNNSCNEWLSSGRSISNDVTHSNNRNDEDEEREMVLSLLPTTNGVSGIGNPFEMDSESQAMLKARLFPSLHGIGGSGSWGMSQKRKADLLGMAHKFRATKAKIETDAMYGLDARKDPSKVSLSSPPSMSWIPQGKNLWRTIRYESSSTTIPTAPITTQQSTTSTPMTPMTTTTTTPQKRFHTLNITIHQSGNKKNIYEIHQRIGTKSMLGDIECLPLQVMTSKVSVDVFVEHFRYMMSLEGCKCLADVSNPNV